MARPNRLRLDATQLGWRTAPMPGANLPLELVRLESADGTFAMLGRFPAGFERLVLGGYAVAEELLVVTGALELEGSVVGPGTLGFVPAHHRRAPIRSPHGCTVLAWFGGPPDFRPARELTPSPATAVATVTVESAVTGSRLLRTSEADWYVLDPHVLTGAAPPVDAVDLGLTWWARVGAGANLDLPASLALVRIPTGRPLEPS